jgi:aspartate carbamoyltransferase catalytic subunit
MSGGMLVSDPASRDAGLFFRPRNVANLAGRRHLLGLEGMPAGEILEILDHAEEFRNRWKSGERLSDELQGVAVLNAFFEDSTRTRVSFELAEKRLGAIALSVSNDGSSVSKGESLLDTVRTVAAMGVDVIVVRHAAAGVPAHVARHVEVSVINAGDGAHEHPTQGLLDLLTLRDAWQGRFEGRRLAIVGDLAHSRVARSAIHGLNALGGSVVVAGPPTLIPAGIESLGCAVAASVEQALEGADAVMALRIQRERMESGLLPSLSEYARVWGIDRRRMERAQPGAVVMHPGPLNRGVEIASDVADGARSVILDQVANGVAIRSAVLARCAGSRSVPR